MNFYFAYLPMTKKCYVSDCGLFIGLVTEPVTKKDFFDTEFKQGLFKEYLKELNTKTLTESFPKDSKLYHPVAYRIFGEYDLAIFSIVDDLDFGLQIFKPAHGYHRNKGDEYIYSTQVINGLVSSTEKNEKLEAIAENTFLKDNLRFPYISITKLKISNGLLIGNGIELLESIKQNIKLLAKTESDAENRNIEIIIVDTFCNNELTLICFSNSYSTISQYITKIRNLQFSSIEKCNLFLRNCLLSEIATRKAIKSAHLFSEINTIYGYDYTYDIENQQNFILPNDEIDGVEYTCTWTIKPGHTNQFLESAKNYKKGFFDFPKLLPNTNTIHTKHSFEEILHLPGLNKFSNISNHIKQFKTTLFFPKLNEKNIDSTNFDKHPELTNYLKKFAYKSHEIQGIRGALDLCQVSKPTRERVLSMFNNFNNCIVDVVFFISFIELKGYLDIIKTSIIEESKKTNHSRGEGKQKAFNIWLNNSIRYFESAYNNRFHQSNRTNVLPNNSLEFNGGIQQLISLFDATYKSILNPLGSNWSYSDFVHISGFESVQSSRETLRINIIHILHPELFATIIYKEGVNFIFEKLMLPYEEVKDCDNISEIEKERWKKHNAFLELFKDFTERNSKIYDEVIQRITSSYINENSEHYLKLIDNELIFNFFADIAVFCLGFSSEKDVFFFWYWHYYLQMNDCYNPDDENEDVSLRFFMRISIVKQYIKDNYDFEDVQELIPIVPLKLRRHQESIDLVCKELYEVLKECIIIDNKNFFLCCIDLLESVSKTEVISEYKSFLTRKPGFDKRIPENQKFSNFRDNQTIEKSIGHKIKIMNGEIITDYSPNAKSLISDSSFNQRFLFSYLSSLYDFYISNFNEQNSTDLPFTSNFRGGILVRKPENRRKYYSIRSVFYKTLWDFSTKEKIKYLRDLKKNGISDLASKVATKFEIVEE